MVSRIHRWELADNYAMSEGGQFKVLLLSKDLRNGGGVVNVISTLLSHFPAHVEGQHFLTGRRFHATRTMKYLWPVLDLIRLWSTLFRSHYDCVQLNPSLNTKALVRDGMFMTLLNMRRNTPVFIHFHGWESSLAHKMKNSASLRWMFRAIFGKAAILGVLVPEFRRELVEIGIEEKRIRLLTTMFDRNIFENASCRIGRHRSLRVLFMSRLIPEKGGLQVLEAIKKLIELGTQITLTIVGDGPDRPFLETTAKKWRLDNHVSFTGYLKGQAKGEALANADVFVFPSSYGEGCPVSLLEAMGAGLAILTTNVGGVAGTFTDGKEGWLLPNANSDTIVEYLNRLQDRTILHRMRIAAAETAWVKYEGSEVAKVISGIYREIVAE